MSKSNLLLLLFCTSIVLAPIGTLLKIFHLSGLSTFVIMMAIFATFAFAIMLIIEVFSPNRLKLSEKVMWAVCIIPLYFITALLYLAIGRQRILKEYKMLSL